MKKGNATLVWIVLVALTVISWFSVSSGQKQAAAEYEECMAKANTFEAKGIYIDALENYEKALELDSGNFEIIMKIAEMYYQMGDFNGFVSACDNALAVRSNDPTPYIKKANYYMEYAKYDKAIEVVKSAALIKDCEELEALREILATKCIEKYVSFSEIKDWHVQGEVNYVAVQEKNKWGMTLKDGTKKLQTKYEYIGAYDKDSGVIPCCLDGLYYYIDIRGNKKLIGDVEYQYLGSFGNGLAPAQRNNLYGYIDTEFTEYKFEYEYAGAFSNNVAAVKKDGKWALINEKFESVTEFIYDEILCDSNGFCSIFNVIIARQGEQYVFLNHKGEQVGGNKYDNVSLPASNDSYIAVKKGELWGFVDQNGDIVMEPQYQDAKSFSLGLAPVKVGEAWGYINTKGELVVEAEYTDAGVFSQDGSATVKKSTIWYFLVLCEYDE